MTWSISLDFHFLVYCYSLGIMVTAMWVLWVHLVVFFFSFFKFYLSSTEQDICLLFVSSYRSDERKPITWKILPKVGKALYFKEVICK